MWIASVLGCWMQAGAPDAAPPSPLPEAVPAPWEQPCAALPALPGAGGRIELAFHDYERPEALRRFWLVDAGAACPADEGASVRLGLHAARVCVPVPAADLAAGWAALVPLRSVRVREVPLRPHHGGRSVTAVWATGRCEIDLADYTEVHPDDEARVRAALDAVQSLGHAAGSR